jgi:hypothetical protein
VLFPGDWLQAGLSATLQAHWAAAVVRRGGSAPVLAYENLEDSQFGPLFRIHSLYSADLAEN